MGKSKAKKRQIQQAGYIRRLAAYPSQVPGSRTLLPVNCFGGDGFQAPHESQESMPELTDDTSPSTPMVAGGWKPVGASSESAKQSKTSLNITSIKQNNWLKFQKSQKKTGNQKLAEKNQPIFEEEANVAEETKPSTSQNSNKEIKWELNKIDDKAEQELNKHEALAKPVVLAGTASEIKLFNPNKTAASIQKVNVRMVEHGNVLMDRKFTTNPAGPMPIAAPRQSRHPPVLSLQNSYPKGVPRSFLANQQRESAIEPQKFAFESKEFAMEPQNKILDRNQPTWAANHSPMALSELKVQTGEMADELTQQQYSPSDAYNDGRALEPGNDGSTSPESQLSYKRLSAFQRLGPQAEPKKPKLTINLLCSKDQSVREVVDTNAAKEEEDKYTPVHLRDDIKASTEEVVVKYLPVWPWRKNIGIRKSVTARNSKSVMILEQEQMEEAYERENIFIQVSVRGYPPSWKKEKVLDAILDGVRGKSFIPCFVEFKPKECKFLTVKCRSALTAIHKLGFYIRKDDVELATTLSLTDLTLKQIDFIPRLVLRKLLAQDYDGERKLSLKEFTIKNDVSHFIYFPLSRVTNQTELVQIQSTVAWNYLTDLDLSHNRLTCIDGFELPITTPRLKHLDLSYNCLERVSVLLHGRELSLRSLRLEGNPLCHDYTDPGHYVRVVKMIFSGLTELDGVPIHLKGDFPQFKRNYCPTEAIDVANKFLEIFFPLLDSSENRVRIEALYDESAVMTVTYRYNLRHSSLHRKFRNLFLRARILDEGDDECIMGAAHICAVLAKWPDMQHDPFTFNVDVLHHTETSTILRVNGILKLTSKTLADDEHLVAFTRTLVLTTTNGMEYKILNEMVYWDEPCKEWSSVAFQMNSIRVSKWPMSLKLDSSPDEKLKRKLLDIFMQITDLEKTASERCLEQKEWNLKTALELFMKLVKLDDLNSLKEIPKKL